MKVTKYCELIFGKLISEHMPNSIQIEIFVANVLNDISQDINFIYLELLAYYISQ